MHMPCFRYGLKTRLLILDAWLRGHCTRGPIYNGKLPGSPKSPHTMSTEKPYTDHEEGKLEAEVSPIRTYDPKFIKRTQRKVSSGRIS